MKLRDYRDKVIEYHRQYHKYQELRSLLDIKGQDYSNLKVQTSPKDKMAELVAKVIEQEEAYKKSMNEAVGCRIALFEQILRLENKDERRALINRYLCLGDDNTEYLEWKDIAQSLNWSESKAYKIHKRAVKHFYALQSMDNLPK